ncbi:hypothetical protein AVEN_27809-1 [Araneus ventricosus]|uniref:Uncharacterized protein n=1 Tax=Araneus ventricosus TaxID=182803 RepID=A0A4Y2EM01_ARAVE|nr:hypothetical protein AVEN_27809-1 [Araneus ventricosus]
MEWRHPGSTRLRKNNSTMIAKKVILSFFFSEERPQLIDCPEREKTVHTPTVLYFTLRHTPVSRDKNKKMPTASRVPRWMLPDAAYLW